MLKRVLIANRGEIALRVLRACREAGIETVAVYSKADQEALHVQLATQSLCIGPAKAADSYLNQSALLTAAKATGCDGIHPGYGFLSENADFADLCAREGITFIGPSGDTIRKAGSKSAARDLMRQAGVPVTPGSDGPVGTVEFLRDSDGTNFYFMEMNTRIQVEHGITELITGVDLVRQQLRIASGLPLDVSQEEVCLTGHAIECRINAEDPGKNFQPCPGTVEFLHFPGGPGVRVDSCLYNGCALSPYYDSMAAKLLVHAPTRLEAIKRMRRCLEEFALEGFATNAELSYQILYHPVFVRGGCTTAFLDDNLAELLDFSRRLEESEGAQ